MNTQDINIANTINTDQLSFELAPEIKHYLNKELAKADSHFDAAKSMLFITEKLVEGDLLSFMVLNRFKGGWHIESLNIYQLSNDTNDVMFLGLIYGNEHYDDIIDGLSREELLDKWQSFTLNDIANEIPTKLEVGFTAKHLEIIKRANPHFAEKFLEQYPELV